ncbi:uncharacterized protein BYT42DRAFT_492783 [Radiomyces spectabilis]|uniref:uncharacterized protein n=1 Tax=Radiomyces spectabilis TaxID=64574 RepID=UPI0022207377|nr:uncharacterized protein BYT42DRAFT_492783 [Radiomyces spectabilis]KAI8384866.1 hypothetical protein BYT42DRAFT_492783 [Radiomyces spectabilis]
MHWQKTNQQGALDGAEAVWANRDYWWSDKQENVFQRKLNGQLVVVVAGVENPSAILSAHDPAFYVTDDHAVDFSAFAKDTAQHISEHSQSGYVATYSKDSIQALPFMDANAYAAQAYNAFQEHYPELTTSTFDMQKEADKSFVLEVEQVRDIIKAFTQGDRAVDATTDYVAIDFSSLNSLKEAYGVESSKYREAELVLKNLFEKTIIPDFQQHYAANDRAVATFVMAPSSAPRFIKRAVPEAAVDDSCFESKEFCEENTDGCNGRGSCKSDGECYACQCSTTFFGPSCQFEDVSDHFQLLFWTSVGLIIVTAGVLVFVYKSGNIENGGIMMGPQALPKQD